MLFRKTRFPKPNNSITSIGPLNEIQYSSNTIAGVKKEIIRIRFTFTDQTLDIIPTKRTAAEMKLENEIGRTMRRISLWRTIDTVVGMKSRLPVTVNGTVRWLTVVMRVVIWGKSFLHGELIIRNEKRNPN
jgi:hypothetical protein